METRKPLINALVTCGDLQPVWIPLPVAIDYETIIALSDRTEHWNEKSYPYEGERILAYRSSFGVTPDAGMCWCDVDRIVKRLINFTPEQLDCVKGLCDTFNLTFNDIDGFVSFLCEAKNLTDKEINENGIPMKNKGI